MDDDDGSDIEFVSQPIAGPSRHQTAPNYLRRQEITQEVARLEAELSNIQEDVSKLQALAALRKDDRDKLLAELQHLTAPANSSSKGKAVGTDYTATDFPWSRELKAQLRKVFKMQSFRLCQEGVCNANMDGRDIVCVMPTGGGKSLTYQLPALLNPGCTLVISPLIALITDQIIHLLEAGIEAVKLTGGTSKTESRDIHNRLVAMANGKRGPQDREIKLLYVTPEKIAKSKSFMAMLQKVADGGQLSRIVIDEAHCVSQLGHDFRPDYQRLHVLRQSFPRIPIMALSATCPPEVLRDLLRTLGMKPVTNGTHTQAGATVYFSSPLYRPNLHYRVLPKPSSAQAAIVAMKDYILEAHPQDTGIIYCWSRKDAERVAAGINKESGGSIKTGVYHAERDDDEKDKLHRQWRKGEVKVVCATIAFGLGIDKGDVRFVIHHSLSKSLDGYYQESGKLRAQITSRAGRDGKDSDCLLFFRPADFSHICAMMASERDGAAKLHAMLDFAQDMRECRKIAFAKYFSHSSQVSMSSWTTAEKNALATCNHCDNCTRTPDTYTQRDVTLEAWQVLRVADAVKATGGQLTLAMLADLARGLGGGSYEVGGGGRRGGKQKMDLDLELVCGGKVGLKKDEVESLVIDLLVQKYLVERYHQTAYSTVVYLETGPLALRLTRVPRERLKTAEHVPKIECCFRATSRKTKGKSATGSSKVAGKRKRQSTSSDEEEEDGEDDEREDAPQEGAGIEPSSESEVTNQDGWSYSMRDGSGKRRRTASKTRTGEVIEID